MLRVTDLTVSFPRRAQGVFGRATAPLVAVDRASLEIGRGESLGLVGESGSGKSTLGRAIMQLVRPTSGQVLFDGIDLCSLDETRMRPFRRHIQMVFQDPFSSLNPRMTVGQAVAEPLLVHGLVPINEIAAAVAELFERVGLSPNVIARYPHEFSGGQRQRVGIARALAARPELLICDEPVSSLDVSIQAQIVNLLAQLRRELGLAYLFVSHDLAVVRHMCDRIAVMYLGRVVEIAARDDLYNRPAHPYTRMLIDAVPTLNREAEIARPGTLLRGEQSSRLAPPTGCAFRPRCPYAMAICATTAPTLQARAGGRQVACHLLDDMSTFK